jgi:hypothetical protein
MNTPQEYVHFSIASAADRKKRGRGVIFHFIDLTGSPSLSISFFFFSFCLLFKRSGD